MVQWLGLRALTAQGPGLIPGQRTKIPHPTRCAAKRKKKKKNDDYVFSSLLSLEQKGK